MTPEQTWRNIRDKKNTNQENVSRVSFAVLQDILQILYLYSDKIFWMSLKVGCKCHVGIESAYGLLLWLTYIERNLF